MKDLFVNNVVNVVVSNVLISKTNLFYLKIWSLMIGYSPVTTFWTYVVNHSKKQEPERTQTYSLFILVST